MSARSKPAKEEDVIEHPRLGRLYSCGLGWGQRINVPAFDAFCWPTKTTSQLTRQVDTV